MAKTRSLITLLSLFFGIVIIALNVLFVIEYDQQQQLEQTQRIERIKTAMRILHRHDGDEDLQLGMLHFQRSSLDEQALRQRGEAIDSKDPFFDVFFYEGQTYIIAGKRPPSLPSWEHPNDPMKHDHHHGHPPMGEPSSDRFSPIVLKELPHEMPYFGVAFIGCVDGLLILFFIVMYRKLLPLRTLKNGIRDLRQGADESKILIQGDDEIALVSQELFQTLHEMTKMREARTLFMRNILHELKTPIMKGKLLSETLSVVDDGERLMRVFERLEFLIGEFTTIERFSSGGDLLLERYYRVVDIVDHACDLLFLDHSNVTIQECEPSGMIAADFELFAIALKNLIDNGLRYGDGTVAVQLYPHKIIIANQGVMIPMERRDFSRPFNRSFETSTQGLGLGLYIANTIFTKHGWHLQYEYRDGLSIMTIVG